MQERILQCAYHEIETKGVRFTMSDLARRAGVSTKTLYASFPSKEALITKVIEVNIEDLRKAEDQILHDRNLDLVEKMRQLLALVPNNFSRTYLRVWYELKRYYPEQWKLIDEFNQQEWEHVRIILEQGVEEGVFRRIQLPILIQMYTGTLNQLIDQQLANQHRVTIGEALDAVIDILLGGIVDSSSSNK
ncbi:MULTISPECIES: TetR/AcrR family transcriptional regulator [Bacillales]|uniref:TetR/AcrR family transcriptional regulator n=1 Tax=Bacillales TaxID=1385 RepID=UPI00034ADCBA|nr:MULTISPECIES: TetR/AcrR family transcriptional regulator [Bacillales]KMZ44267.1 transcriptional regulator [Bacillus sp. FJAT-27238]